MQGQPTTAQQAKGAKPDSPTNSQEAKRQMHAQPSVAEQPKAKAPPPGPKGAKGRPMGAVRKIDRGLFGAISAPRRSKGYL